MSTRILGCLKIECKVLSESSVRVQFCRIFGANTKTAIASEPDPPTFQNLGFPWRAGVSTRILEIECTVLLTSSVKVQFFRIFSVNTKTAIASEPDQPTL